MLRILIAILQHSVKKHGENTPLTLGHLLNILLLAQKGKESQDSLEEKEHRKLMDKIDPFGQG